LRPELPLLAHLIRIELRLPQVFGIAAGATAIAASPVQQAPLFVLQLLNAAAIGQVVPAQDLGLLHGCLLYLTPSCPTRHQRHVYTAANVGMDSQTK
jgi:hypothetical protein